MALIRGTGSLVTALREMAKEVGAELEATCFADTFSHVKQLLLGGQSGGLLPAALAKTLPASDFYVLDDTKLQTLDRSLDVVIDQRAGRVRDRLSAIAGALAKAIGGANTN